MDGGQAAEQRFRRSLLRSFPRRREFLDKGDLFLHRFPGRAAAAPNVSRPPSGAAHIGDPDVYKRQVYETPGGTILYKAHEVLEMITIDKDTKHMKTKLAVDFADLIYNGKWFTPLREALQAFAVDTQKHVTGTVKLKLYKGNIITSSVTSPESLYSENLVTFEESDYNQNDATGFINLWGLPDKVQALREQGKL